MINKKLDHFSYNRRQLLRSLGVMGLSSVALGALDSLNRKGLWSFFAKGQGHSGFEILARSSLEILVDALSYGPSLFWVSEAMAQELKKPSVYRVFYGTSHDIRNELCLTGYGSQYNPMDYLNFAGMTEQLKGLIEKAPAPHSILNAWAYRLLTTGKINGDQSLAPDSDGLPLKPEEINRLSIIAAVGVGGSEGVHRRGSIPQVGTLEYAMLKAFPGYSPIGAMAIQNQVIDAAGGVSSAGTSIANFVNAIDVPSVYMSRAKDEDNLIRALDALAGDASVRGIRDQMLDAHNLLLAQIAGLQRFSTLAAQTFATYGQRSLEGLASMMMFADMMKQGLVTVGSVRMDSFDFHATDALRTPQGENGNMLTETAQALAGAFHIARAAFDSKRDAIVHFATCSNRNENWVSDDSRVSTLTLVIKGADQSPYAALPPQLVLVPDNVEQVYAEGPGAAGAAYSGSDAQALGLTGAVTVGRIEASIVRSVAQATGQAQQHPTEEPAGKLL